MNKKRLQENYTNLMLDRMLGMFNYEGLPDSIPQYQVELQLLVNGYTFVYEYNGVLYAFSGTLAGDKNIYGEYTEFLINNPYIKLNKTVNIGDGVLIKNDYKMHGLLDTIEQYSVLASECDLSFLSLAQTSRIQNIITAGDRATIESARQYYKSIEDGLNNVIMDNAMLESLHVHNVSSNNNIINNIVSLKQYIKSEMYNTIGLNSNYNMKKERMITSEIESNCDNLYPLIDTMLKCREDSINKINEKYGLNITIQFDGVWDYRLLNGMSIDNLKKEVTLEEVEHGKQTEDNKQDS
jgi:hypothetical protein